MNSTNQKRSYGTNLYMPMEEKDLMERCAIQISAQTGKQITPSGFARFVLKHFHTEAMIAIINNHNSKS